MYLEGSDQHRGWFQSSLLESCGTRARAPYDIVLTHGFVLDEKGQKMSKSLGNVVAPQEVMKSSGADILRLWVAASDYSDDLRIGPDILKNFVEMYRKLRNTLRWMLGALAHLDPGERVKFKDMNEFELERLMLHRLTELDAEVRAAYQTYDYRKVVSVLSQFMNTELSAFYFDIRKDALYCEPYSSVKRRAALTVIDEIFKALLAWLAPILSFTAEEAWLAREPGREGSVHLETFPELDKAWRNDELAKKWELVRDVRRVVTGALELERAAKRIGSSLEAAPDVYVADRAMLRALEGVELEEVSITSAARLIAKAPPEGAFTLPDVPGVGVVPKRAAGQEMRALVAHPRRCRRRPRLSGPVAARCRRRTRVRPARQGNRMTTENAGLRSWLWGPYSRLGLAVFLVTLVLDQAHKWWMLEVYDIEERGRVAVTPFLDLVFVKNIGISYSMFDQESYSGQIMLAAFGLAATLALWIWLARGATGRLLAVSLGLIMGGAIGNAIDRVLIGGVADFFSLHAFGFYWYVFNIADVAIVAGVIGLLYDSLMASRKDAAKPL